MDKIPTQDEYENAMEGDADLNKKVVVLGELSELAYDDLIFLINTSFSVEKVAECRFSQGKLWDWMGQACK